MKGEKRFKKEQRRLEAELRKMIYDKLSWAEKMARATHSMGASKRQITRLWACGSDQEVPDVD